LDSPSSDKDMEMEREEDQKKMHLMAKVRDLLEM
jgi:hypothetical protein